MNVSLSESQRQIIFKMAQGMRLKDHRDIEGNKRFVIYAPDGRGDCVAREDVEALVDAGLISSNKKFPSATYWLTEAGKALVKNML